MKKYVIPLVGTIAAAVGTFSPLAGTPGGAILAFAGILGLLTLWKSRGEAGLAVRRRAFFCTLFAAVSVAIASQSFLIPPTDGAERWTERGMTLSYIAAFLTVAAAAHYGWFAFRNRAPKTEPRSFLARSVSGLSSVFTVLILLAFAVSAVLFAAQISALSVYAALTPPVRVMMDDMAQAGKPISQQVRKDGDRMVVTGTLFSWDCTDLTALKQGDVPHPTGEADKVFLSRICQD